MKSFKRQCRHCGEKYEYEGAANLITFCPYCLKYDFLECEYGYGPVVPCKIYLGGEAVAEVSYHISDSSVNKYRLDSDKYNIHRVLEKDYLGALQEARDIISEKI